MKQQMALLDQARLFLIQHKGCSFKLFTDWLDRDDIEHLNVVENMYIRGNVKVTDIVVRIILKTYSRRANIYCTSISGLRGKGLLICMSLLSSILKFKMHITPLAVIL